MRLVVSAEGEASGRRIGGLFRSDGSSILLNVRSGTESAVRENRQHCHRAAKVVGDQHKLSGRMNTHIGGTSSAGTDGVEQGQLPVSAVDREGADRAFIDFAHAIGLVGRLETS